jgi:6-pyruvoyltetrahydropterin/6-carboxytetrahydropterin synthase
MLIEKNYSVEYAHRLKEHNGKCKNIHGHSGKVKVILSGDVDLDTGMVFDFGHFGWLKEIVDQLDHSFVLQAFDPMLDFVGKYVDRIIVLSGPPTAETFSRWLADCIIKFLSTESINFPLRLISVTFEETEGNSVTYVVGDYYGY